MGGNRESRDRVGNQLTFSIMKTKTQLSKKQMSAVKGGNNDLTTFECVAFLADGTKEIHHVYATGHVAAADIVHGITGAGQVNCTED